MNYNVVVTPRELYRHVLAKSTPEHGLHLVTTAELRTIIGIAIEQATKLSPPQAKPIDKNLQ